MNLKLLCIGVFLLLCFPFYGEVLVYDDVGFQVEVPDTWETYDEEGLLMATDQEEIAAVLLMPVLAEEFDAAVDELEAMLDEIFTEIEVTDDPEEIELNEMPGIMAFGAGMMEEDPVVWGVVIVFNEETEIALFTITFVYADYYDDFEETILDILMSVSAIEEETSW